MPTMNESSKSEKFAIWVATGLGVGLVSPAPGTIGGLWGLPLAWWVVQLSPLAVQLLVILFIAFAGVVVCTMAARALGGGHDPQSIVLDEIVALPIVYFGVGPLNWKVWLAGWLLFRLCDIKKFPPARSFERWPEGWGIVADDLAAAVQACLVLHFALWLDRAAAWGIFAPVA